MASIFELVVEKLKGMGEQIPGGVGERQKIDAAGEPLYYRVGINRVVSGSRLLEAALA
jgi:hypothetical protein